MNTTNPFIPTYGNKSCRLSGNPLLKTLVYEGQERWCLRRAARQSRLSHGRPAGAAAAAAAAAEEEEPAIHVEGFWVMAICHVPTCRDEKQASKTAARKSCSHFDIPPRDGSSWKAKKDNRNCHMWAIWLKHWHLQRTRYLHRLISNRMSLLVHWSHVKYFDRQAKF